MQFRSESSNERHGVPKFGIAGTVALTRLLPFTLALVGGPGARRASPNLVKIGLN